MRLRNIILAMAVLFLVPGLTWAAAKQVQEKGGAVKTIQPPPKTVPPSTNPPVQTPAPKAPVEEVKTIQQPQKQVSLPTVPTQPPATKAPQKSETLTIIPTQPPATKAPQGETIVKSVVEKKEIIPPKSETPKPKGFLGLFQRQQTEETRESIQKRPQENKQSRQGPKGKPAQEKMVDIQQRRETQYQQNKALRDKQHAENIAFLKEKLAKNPRLTAAQKEELAGFFENQYKENVSFRDQQHSENVAFFQKIANDSKLTMAQKKEAIKAHIKAQKEETKQYREQRKTARKTEFEKIRSQVTTQK